jgi:hypothetical protein
MRPCIEALDVEAMDWAPTPAPGLFTRLLSQDEASGAHTSLYRLSPRHGYQPPTCAHYHHTYEEILPLSGCFSFDSRLWMEPGGYVYHPPMTVHGFRSAIREESVFLSRIGRTLDFNYVPEPAQTQIYLVDDSRPSRQPAALGDAVGAVGWRDAAFLGGGASASVLSTDAATGEGSAIVRVPAGWRSAAAQLPEYLELFVVEGSLAAQGAAVPRHGYFFYPPGTPVAALAADAEATLFVSFGGPIGL